MKVIYECVNVSNVLQKLENYNTCGVQYLVETFRDQGQSPPHPMASMFDFQKHRKQYTLIANISSDTT